MEVIYSSTKSVYKYRKRKWIFTNHAFMVNTNVITMHNMILFK